MSPEVISQASYSTILTIAFDLRHRLEYLTFGDRERQLFNFRFIHRLYGERCTCKSCGASGAAHIPNESEHLNLSGYLMEWGVVGHIKGKCVCCGAPFSHYSCESHDICKLDPKFRIYGLELKYYSMKATHHSLLHNMMELVLLESIDDDKQRQEAFAAISSFMHLGVRRVSDLWCRPDYYQMRKDKFERWKQDTLLVPGSHPLIPPQSYRSYFEMYEMLSRSFVENSVAVASALDLIQYALVDNPSVRNFKMILGAAMMYLNRFQEFIRLHDPKEFMIPSDPLYQQVKHRFITSDLSIVKRMLVIIMIYEMPQFFHYGDFLRVANGEKDMFTHGGVDLCRCLVKQGRILDNDKLKRSKKGKDDLMRQQLRIKNIRIGQIELEDIPRQFVRYFGQSDQAPNLFLALKALNLENKVQQIEVLQPRGSPPTMVIDLAKLPRRVLLCPEKVIYPEVTEVMKVQEEAIWYRIDKYIQILKKKKNRNKEDLFEFDEEFYKIDIDPKILKKFERLGFNVNMESDPEDSNGEGGKNVPSSKQDDREESLSAGENEQSTAVATPIKEEVTPLTSYLPLEQPKNHPEGCEEEEHTHRTTDVPPLLSSGQVSTSVLSGEVESVESSADSRENVREKEGHDSRSVRSESNSKSKLTTPKDEDESSSRSSTKESASVSGKDKVSDEDPAPPRHQEGRPEASQQREQSELVTVDLSKQEVDTLIEKADVIVVIVPKKSGKSAGTTPKRTKKVASLPPTRYQKIVSVSSEKSKKVSSTPSEETRKVTSTPSEEVKKVKSTPSEETRKVASTPSEETKKVASTPSEETKKVASTPSEEAKKVKSTPSEETKKVASTPSEEAKKVKSTPSEETKKVASTPSEETKKVASTPSEETRKVASTPSEETKKVASTPSEETKKVASTPSEEAKKVKSTPSEETKKVASTPSEETKKVASTPSEETKKVDSTPSEETKKVASTPSEETKKVASTPSEETKKVASTPSEETKKVASTPSEETKKVTSTSSEETKKFAHTPSDENKTTADTPLEETKNVADSLSRETRNVVDSPSEESKTVAGSPSEETKNVADSPSEETKNVVDSPSEETKNVADSPSEETKNVADSPSEETKNVADSPSEETKNVADSPCEETKNVADSPSEETKNVASTKQEKIDSSTPVGGSSPLVEQKQPHSLSQRSCAYCGGVREKLLRCKRCKLVFYCHSTCQKAHWKTHKINCISTS